jgi:peptide/nickel transport system permease protein
MTGASVDLGAVERAVPSRRPSRRERFRETLSLITSSRVAMVGLALVLFWIGVAIFSLFTTMDPYAQDVEAVNSGPSAKHLLGTDDLGRDLLSRVVHGSRTVLMLAPISVLIALSPPYCCT